MYFSANNGTGQELWRSDGTTDGTFLVKDILPGSLSSGITNLTNVNGTLYFSAGDFVNGLELWKSDGTAAGTVQVKDIWPGADSSSPTSLTNVNGWVVFSANDGVNGNEVWISDGTVQGTQLLADVFSGSAGSTASKFTVTGMQLLFSAVGAGVGKELWTIPLPPVTLAKGVASIDLSDATTARNLSVRMNAGYVTVQDLSTNTVFLGPNSELPANELVGLRIIGSSAFSENITIDHSFNGVVNLPMGFEFDGGAGGTDTVTIIGASGVDATLSQTSQETVITSGQVAAGVTLKYRNVESLTMTSLRRVAVAENLDIAIPISVSNQLPFDLGAITTLAGGSLSSSSSISLGNAESIIGDGSVAGRFSGEAGSLILATGNMTIGNASSVAGFLTRGELDAGTSAVTLLDANQAVLGSLTTLGNTTTDGTVIAANGALIDFGNNLVGYGTLNTPNLAAKATTINGNVEETSLTQPITLAGYVKGVGSLNNVSVTGTYSPGFSPAAVTLGSVSYGPTSITVVELGGTVPGTQHDQLNHIGSALLGGTLDLELINGYQPVFGDSFTIFTATAGISGTFASVQLPPISGGLEWSINYGAQSVVVGVTQTLGNPILTITSGNAVYNNATYVATTSITGDNAPAPTLSFEFYSDVGGTNLISAPENVGTYYVRAFSAANGTNNAAQSSIATFQITPFALTVSAAGVNRIYDGSVNASVVLSDNRFSGDALIVTNAAATLNDKNVGMAKPINVTGINVTGADAGNYTFNTFAAATADIARKALTVSAAGQNKVYDGNVVATVALSDDRVLNDVFDVTYGTATFDNANVGTGKPIGVSGISVMGTDVGNYTYNPTASTTADINAVVVNRRIFYNGATTVGGAGATGFGASNTVGASFAATSGNPPVTAIDTKVALLPGGNSSFLNYTNVVFGINGIVVDLKNPTATITAADFSFATGETLTQPGFTTLVGTALTAVNPQVTQFIGGGIDGSTRAKITFNNNSLKNIWLKVTVLANANTGLAIDDVFYFGNVVGEVNGSNVNSRYNVNAIDTGAVRTNQSTPSNSVSVTNLYDFNKSGNVNALDTSIVRTNQQTSGVVKVILSAPPSLPFGGEGEGMTPSFDSEPLKPTNPDSEHVAALDKFFETF